MSTEQTNVSSPVRLRLWPGVVIVALQWLVRFGLPRLVPEVTQYAVLGAVIGGGLGVLVWWAFFSRAPHLERWGAIVLMVLAMAVTPLFLHVSVATSMMGAMFFVYAVPILSLAFVLWAVAGRQLSPVPRRATLVAAIVLACGLFTLVQTGGFDGEVRHDLSWRWAATPEERLLAEAGGEVMVAPPPAVPLEAVADWPGFRGPRRDGVVRGVRIATDWSQSPPAELWRRPVGPGWSSFAVHGDLFYTQEQRGEDEVVAAYRVSTGEPVWRHRDSARFWEANAGAGPRGTPTLSNGRVYSFGATGILNVLEAGDGSLVWSRNAAADTGAKLPVWGFSSSPLVVDDTVIVAASGALAAYDLRTGELRWSGPVGGESYSSPHLLTLDGVAQVLLLGGTGATSVTPADGTLLWEHPWSGFPIVQPALVPDGDVLISASEATGTLRLAVARKTGGWTLEERWTSTRLKPFYSDVVVHGDHAFGFDGSILACIDLEDGQRRWKDGRYGAGQLILLADQDLLLVLSEKGELALVDASFDRFNELARFPVLKGKTWNHPVLVGDVVLVRNAQEMAAFRLRMASSEALTARGKVAPVAPMPNPPRMPR